MKDEHEPALQSLWEQGRAVWPQIDLPLSVFSRHLARHLRGQDGPQGQEEKTTWERRLAHAGDLYLACACAEGMPAAHQALDRTILAQVPLFVSRVSAAPAFADEVRQLLREKLLVMAGGAAPRIADYSGAGPLSRWVRVAAMRTALNLRRDEGAGPPRDGEAAVEEIALPADRELDYLRSRHQQEFKDALQAAFAGLSQEQRNVLRMHYAGGLSGDRIATLMQKSRPTVTRLLASARTAMMYETRRLLQERLRLTPGEMDSLIRVVRSQLDVSIASLLKQSGDCP